MSEEEAWNLANSGYRFPGIPKVGKLTKQELLELAMYPSIVSFSKYQELQLLSRHQLLRKAKGIEVFYPNISKSDLFFYLTRGWLPQDVSISAKLKRYYTFENLLETTKMLFMLMYTNVVEFCSAKASGKYPNIEKVLLLYDEMLGIDTTIDLISKLFGINIVGESMSIMNTLLYSKLYAYIKVFTTQTPSPTPEFTSPINVEQSVGMSEQEWKNTDIYKEYKQPYETRTDYIIQTFYNLDDETIEI
jgi:hypothetical protein